MCEKDHELHAHIWQYGLWSFQSEGTKLEIFLPKNQHTEKEIVEFWVSFQKVK